MGNVIARDASRDHKKDNAAAQNKNKLANACNNPIASMPYVLMTSPTATSNGSHIWDGRC